MTACHNCGAEHAWNWEQDTFVGAQEFIISHNLSVWHCVNCPAVIGIWLVDATGSTLYLPSKKEDD